MFPQVPKSQDRSTEDAQICSRGAAWDPPPVAIGVGAAQYNLALGSPPLPRGCGLPCSCMHTHLVRIYLQPLSSSRQLPSSPAGGHGAPSSRARGPSKKSAASALPFSPGVRGHGRRREEPVPATRELTSLGTISSAGPRAAETGRGLGMT